MQINEFTAPIENYDLLMQQKPHEKDLSEEIRLNYNRIVSNSLGKLDKSTEMENRFFCISFIVFYMQL